MIRDTKAKVLARRGQGRKSQSYPADNQSGVHQASWQGETYSSWDLPTAAKKVSEGLPTEALSTVQHRLGLSNSEMAHIVQISPRTLTRRKKEERLPPDESERVYRIARLVEIAAGVLGGKEEARQWMKEPNYALGEQTPLEVVRTEPGAGLVERLLGQIEYGIPV